MPESAVASPARRNDCHQQLHESPQAYRTILIQHTCSSLEDTAGNTDSALQYGTQEKVQMPAEDIYRGDLPPPSVPITAQLDVEQETIASTVSTTSSLRLNFSHRLGALAVSVEAAISRWARARSSNSSTTTTSSSSSSMSTATRTTTTRRRHGRRYSDGASELNAARERAIHARKRAREEFRAVPRKLTLLLPTEHISGLSKAFRDNNNNRTSRQLHFVETAHERALKRRTVCTSSLPLIISQLELALKRSAKWRRAEEKVKGTEGSCLKGKHRMDSVDSTASRFSTKSMASNFVSSKFMGTEKGWWLDVASPTSDDMRSLARLLHIHPLTLEDILHQDPREKLEIFPRLGYYFLVFRALEGEKSRERFRRFSSQDSDIASSIPTEEASVGAVNLYLVVFKEGICTFHFDDVSEHTDRMRNKIVSLEDTFHMTSDWIAHGLLDSIVDSFFPHLVSIEKEVKELEDLVLQDFSRAQAKEEVQVQLLPVDSVDPLAPRTARSNVPEKIESPASSKHGTSHKEKIDGKPHNLRNNAARRLGLPIVHLTSWVATFFSERRRYVNFLLIALRLRSAKGRSKKATMKIAMSSTTMTLHRMVATRRLVTSLDRLLSAKGTIIAQLRKRLLNISGTANPATGLGPGILDKSEIAIYMSDIQDHIITLQQSLLHYEHVLNEAHPTYLSRLGNAQSITKQTIDQFLLLLGTVTVAISTIQIPVGVLSINSGKVPKSPFKSDEYKVFGVCLALFALMVAAVVFTIQYWKRAAKKKYSRPVV